jgi:hypothetical protein
MPQLTTVKDFMSSLQSFATVVALIAGGWWFFEQRQDAARLKVEHTITGHQDTSPDFVLVGVEIKASNTGNTHVRVPVGTIRLIDIVSQSVDILKEDGMQAVELEPGESDQIYFKTFHIPKSTGTIRIETVVPDDKADLQLTSNSLFDVKAESKEYSATETSPHKQP